MLEKSLRHAVRKIVALTVEMMQAAPEAPPVVVPEEKNSAGRGVGVSGRRRGRETAQAMASVSLVLLRPAFCRLRRC